MGPKNTTEFPQTDLFRAELVNPIDLRHALVRLADTIDLSSPSRYSKPPGPEGDAMPALLCRAGQNMRFILRKLRLVEAWIIDLCLRPFYCPGYRQPGYSRSAVAKMAFSGRTNHGRQQGTSP